MGKDLGMLDESSKEEQVTMATKDAEDSSSIPLLQLVQQLLR